MLQIFLYAKLPASYVLLNELSIFEYSKTEFSSLSVDWFQCVPRCTCRICFGRRWEGCGMMKKKFLIIMITLMYSFFTSPWRPVQPHDLSYKSHKSSWFVCTCHGINSPSRIGDLFHPTWPKGLTYGDQFVGHMNG